MRKFVRDDFNKIGWWVARMLLAVPLFLSSSSFAQNNPGQLPAADGDTSVEAVEDTINDLGDGSPSPEGASGARPDEIEAGVSSNTQGLGFKLSQDGRTRIHVGFDTGMGFDTNPYSTPLSSTLTNFSAGALGRVRPSIGFRHPGSMFALDVFAAIDYGILIGVPDLEGASQYFLNQSEFQTEMEIGRGAMFSFVIADNFAFRIDPGFVTVGSLLSSVTNDIRAGAELKPGGGTLSLKVDTFFSIQKYYDIVSAVSESLGNDLSDGNALPTENLDNLALGIRGRTDYRFLPKTGLFLEAKTGFHFYYLDFQNSPMSFPTRVNVGLMGQFTKKIGGLVQIGYANPFTLDPAKGFDSLTFIGLVGQGEIRWAITQSTGLSLGALRQMAPVPLYQHVTNNRAYVDFTQSLGDSFVFRTNTGYSLLQFGRDSTDEQESASADLFLSQGSRYDGHWDWQMLVAYYLWDWLSVGLSNDLDFRLTTSQAPDIGNIEGENLSFLRNSTMLLISLNY
jgi:hypothetical protein